MILNVRGGLGMQVLETMVGYAKAIERNEYVEAIEISTGGDVVDPVKHNFLGSVINVAVPIGTTNSKLKQNAWTKENFELLVKHYDEVMKCFEVKTEKAFTGVLRVFHIRGKDRQIISENTYRELIEQFSRQDPHRFYVFSDDFDLAERVISELDYQPLMNTSLALQAANQDWQSCVTAMEIMGPFSTFTLSAWLMNPKIHYTVLGPKYNDNMPIAREYYEMLNILFEGIPGNGNIRFD
jgi:hypothetical protein